jgi:hypothetical protein
VLLCLYESLRARSAIFLYSRHPDRLTLRALEIEQGVCAPLVARSVRKTRRLLPKCNTRTGIMPIESGLYRQLKAISLLSGEVAGFEAQNTVQRRREAGREEAVNAGLSTMAQY